MPYKTKKLLEIGDVIYLNKSHTVYADVQERFVYSNRPKSTRICHSETKIGRFDEYPEGEYLVVDVRENGGRSFLEMKGHTEFYSNGHHVYCRKLNSYNQPIGQIVDFWQTGFFNVMIENIEPVRKLKQIITWKEE